MATDEQLRRWLDFYIDHHEDQIGHPDRRSAFADGCAHGRAELAAELLALPSVRVVDMALVEQAIADRADIDGEPLSLWLWCALDALLDIRKLLTAAQPSAEPEGER